MGCDYYIVKELLVVYKHHATGKEKTTEIELDRQRCYFLEYTEDVSCDSDDSDYLDRKHARQHSYIEECLRVTFQPRTLFENNMWKNEETRQKYEDRIKTKIMAPIELVRVIKQEIRYLR
jgi:hypothetical protein